MKKLSRLLLITILSFVSITGCGTKKEESTITIADQYGLAYAPIQIMKAKNYLGEHTEKATIKWKKLANTAAIREAMLAGEVDIGFMAIPPFLIGKDKGMEWKMFSGLARSPLGLMTYKEDIRSLADLSQDDRIALPQPGSIQHILLAMAAEREFGDAKRFDSQLVTMAHPDGMNALLSKREITAHFTSPPYIFKESKEKGIHQILNGEEALGGQFSFIVGVCTEDFHDQYPELYSDFVKALDQSIEFVNQHPGETARILTKNYDLSKEEIQEYITWPGMEYSKQIQGLDEFIAFMQKAEYIDLNNVKISQLLWEVNLYEAE